MSLKTFECDRCGGTAIITEEWPEVPAFEGRCLDCRMFVIGCGGGRPEPAAVRQLELPIYQ